MVQNVEPEFAHMILLRIRSTWDTVLRWTKTLNAKTGEKNVSNDVFLILFRQAFQPLH